MLDIMAGKSHKKIECSVDTTMDRDSVKQQ